MKTLDEMTLTERVKLYADGDEENGIPPHGFDFSHEDMKNIMEALRITWLLSREEPVHNYQYERSDLRDFCVVTNGIVRIARTFAKRCPLKAMFRLDEVTGNDEKMDGERREDGVAVED